MAAKPDRATVVLTSYDIALRDRVHIARNVVSPIALAAKGERADFCACKWKYLVVDEGHRLKNFESKLIKVRVGERRPSKEPATVSPLRLAGASEGAL
jgi:hypothetical protein